MIRPRGDAPQHIIELARCFPSIAARPEVAAWDAYALDRWALAASPTQRLACQFVLGVWDRWTPWSCGGFEVTQAVGVWDERHWDAFRAWAASPYALQPLRSPAASDTSAS